MKTVVFFAALLSLAWAEPALADVTYKQETNMSSMIKRFNRKQTTVTRISGDKMRTESGRQIQIVDLGEEKIYNLDSKKNSYSVMTFEEMKQRMKEAMVSTKESVEQNKVGDVPDGSPRTDLKVTDTGNMDQIKGYSCRRYWIQMNASVEEKDGVQENQFSTHTVLWLTKEAPGVEEISSFHGQMAGKLGTAEIGAQMMAGESNGANAFAVNMREMAREMTKLDGLTLRSVFYYGSADAVNRNVSSDSNEKEGADKDKNGEGLLMKMTTDIDDIHTEAVDPKLFAVPDHYKLVEQ